MNFVELNAKQIPVIHMYSRYFEQRQNISPSISTELLELAAHSFGNSRNSVGIKALDLRLCL